MKLGKILTCGSRWLVINCFFLWLVGCDDFIAEDVSNEEIVLLAPGDQVEIDRNQLTFWWESLALRTKYRLEIVTPSFENPTSLVMDSLLDTHQLKVELDVGQYAWRVRAENGLYYSIYSDVRSFVITSQSDTLAHPESDGSVVGAITQ